MAQVSYPGVYVKEVPSGVRTVTSVSTSIAAFLGRATKGPINKAVRLLSLSDLERNFGVPHPKSKLAQSVRHFFANGGSDCYVVRLAKNAEAAGVTLRALRQAGTDQDVLEFTAKAEGQWANTVRLEVDYNTPTPDESFNLRVIQEDGGEVVDTESYTNLSMNVNSPRFAPSFVSASSNLVKVDLAGAMGDPADSSSGYNSDTLDGFSMARRPFPNAGTAVRDRFNNDFFDNDRSHFQISVNNSPYVLVDLASDGDFTQTSIGDIETELASRINAALSSQLSPAQQVSCTFTANISGVGRFLTITAATPGADVDNISVKVRRASSKDLAAPMMLGVDQGGVEPTRWSNFRPAPTASIVTLGDVDTAGDLSGLDVLSAIPLDASDASAITSITIDPADPIDLINDYSLETRDTTGNPRWVRNAEDASEITDDHDGIREKLRIIARAINDSSAVDYRAEVWGYRLALIATSGSINNTPTISTSHSALGDRFITNVRQYTLGTGGSGSFSTDGADGTDGDAPGYDEFRGNPTAQTGFHALDSVDLFNLMILPEDEEVDESTMNDLWGPASNYCEANRAFLLVNPPREWTDEDGRPEVAGNTDLINDLRVSLVKDHAAVFYPRVTYRDGSLTKSISPAGAVAGLMARTDGSRGVWKAPAGIEAGLRGVNGLQVELTDAENGVLNKKGVNCIRLFPNGIVNWGARTLDGDDDFGSEWKYVPIRRLALMIQESLYRGTRWAVFEPNDEPLWADIRKNLRAYMMSLFRRGAFQGTDPSEAFYVKCDKETTTQDDRNKGIVNIEVGFAPLKPAEFVVIRIQQMAGEL